MKRLFSFFFPLLFLLVVLPGVALAEEAVQAAQALPGTDLVNALLDCLPASWGSWVTMVIAICAAVAVVLPAPKEGSNIVWRVLYWLIQVLALNKGRAANAQDAKSGTNVG